MRELADIFGIWESMADMARDLGLEYQTVAKWAQRRRIPPESWADVIEAAHRKDVALSAAILNKLNSPRGTTLQGGARE